MKYLILLLLSLNVLAATSQVNRISNIGGGKNNPNPVLTIPSTSVGLSALRTLSVQIGSSTANNFLALNYLGGSGGAYQVASSKSLYCFEMRYESSGGGNRVGFGYGSSALSGNSSSAPTSPVYFSAGASNQGSFFSASSGVGTWEQHPISMVFPQNTYPFIQTIDGSVTWSIILSCAEI